ncbi:MAG: DNA gyrase subunit A [Rhodospirillaceae bacterium]|nr:DNA gyrase subunit A [Rhodospirillaceae bacterium]|tara:strand:+ start:2374 stop:5130 length:2757 start_codon:yes stop_codon:yes gene_type:complete
MKSSYLDYAMSVIVSRALPDVRDGLKPVHRRILYSMKESGYEYNKPFRKSARIVGDVMGKYHPHGDQAIYDAMVRMAQDFSLRLMLIDGQGNFGSMDGDRAAAMRYTEARLTRAAHALLEDIDKETVDFKPNYDETVSEPSVLPAGFPTLLVNGAGGIAVGMATNIPPHNLGEVIDACCAYVDDPDISIEQLIENHVQGPDFPTGGLIMGRSGILQAYLTGRGSVVMRGKTSFEEVRKDRQAIIIHEVPFQVNKARMIEIMAEAVRDKRIEGISDLRDESDRKGVRVVVELKRSAEPKVVLAQLFRFTPLQTSFGVNMLALNRGRPQLMNLKQIIAAFVEFREEVIRRRTIHELGKAREKAHMLAGLAVAVINIDEVIALIRAAKDSAQARRQLMKKAWPAKDVEDMIKLLDEPGRAVVKGVYKLSEAQAKAILELRLHRLTGLERGKIGDDLKELGDRIGQHLVLLGSRDKLYALLRQELLEMKEQFADARRTAIDEGEFEHDIEDLIQREDMVVTVTNTGYVKRVPLSTYRAQRRGGKGRAGMGTHEEDFVNQVFVVNTHTPVLFFSSTGIVYKLKVYKLPLGTPQARGRALINLLPLDDGETITTMMPLPEDEDAWGGLFVMFATASGGVRRNSLKDFVSVMANGKIAMKLADGDKLVRVRTCTEDEDILLSARGGKCIRFPVTNVRVFVGRTSTGVRGIKLVAKGDEVIAMSVLRHVKVGVEERDEYLAAVNAARRLKGGDYTGRAEDKVRDGELAAKLNQEKFIRMAEDEEFLLTIAADGLGKRSSAYEYRIARRGGQGIANIDLTRGKKKTHVAAAFTVLDSDQIVMVSDSGQIIRCSIDKVSIVGRSSRGVTIFKTAKGEQVVSVSHLRDVDNGDGEEGGDETAGEAPEEGGEEAPEAGGDGDEGGKGETP